MRTLIIPKDGAPFLGEDVPDGQKRFARLAEPYRMCTTKDPTAYLPEYRPVSVLYYEFRFHIADCFGNIRLAVFEQI